jgi:hypothetical protein
MARFPQLSHKLSIRSSRSKRDPNSQESTSSIDGPREFDPKLAARFSFVDTSNNLLDHIVESSSEEKHGLESNNHNEDRPVSAIQEEDWPLQNNNKRSSFASSRFHRSHSLSRRRSVLSGDWSFHDTRRRSLNDLMCDAASSGDVPQIGRLLGAGADPRRKSKDGLSPIHLAAAGGHLSVLKSLVMHGVRLDTTDIEGRTPLHIAVITRHASIIPFLLSHGAPLDAKDVHGYTAMQLAAQQGAEDPADFDAEDGGPEQVRFSYVFGQPEANKRASVTSNRSTHTTPLEALAQAGAYGEVLSNDRIVPLDFAVKAGELRNTVMSMGNDSRPHL